MKTENSTLPFFEPLLHEITVAEDWFGGRPADLRRLREQGKGPPFVMIGRAAMYRRIDVEAWLAREAAASVQPTAMPAVGDDEEATPSAR